MIDVALYCMPRIVASLPLFHLWHLQRWHRRHHQNRAVSLSTNQLTPEYWLQVRHLRYPSIVAAFLECLYSRLRRDSSAAPKAITELSCRAAATTPQWSRLLDASNTARWKSSTQATCELSWLVFQMTATRHLKSTPTTLMPMCSVKGNSTAQSMHSQPAPQHAVSQGQRLSSFAS